MPAPTEAAPDVKLFVPPGHFYSPIAHPVEADRALARLESGGIPETLPGIAITPAAMAAAWNRLLPYLRETPFPETKTPGFRYAFDNEAYGWGDASMLCAMLRDRRPSRLIEVGSGWSSACSLDTIDRYLGGNCDVTFIEPYPALLYDLCGDALQRAKVIGKPVQEAPLTVFDELGAGDILFIDSTHIVRTGSDVCFELFEVLPRLARGVLVHLHDIFWPFEYPRAWAVDQNRSWNELYAIRAFLMYNPDWRVVMFNDYIWRVERPLIEQTYPTFLRNPGGALWLERC